jgi:hypothetical protein
MHFLLWLRHASCFSPVFFRHVFVNPDGACLQAIRSVFLATGDPVLFSRYYVEVVCLETASGKGLKSLPAVVQRLSRLGEFNATDSRWAGDAISLVFDIHYS